MPASTPQGQMQFWINGAPFAGVQNSTHDAGQMQFWINGAPMPYVVPATTTALSYGFIVD